MRFPSNNTSGLCVQAHLRCAGGWVDVEVGGRPSDIICWGRGGGAESVRWMKRRRCPGSTAGTVLTRDRWRCRARKQTSPCSQRQAPASICTRSPPPPPHPPSITPSLPPPPAPAPHNPFACNLSQAERGFSSFLFFFPEHSRCLSLHSSPLVSAESGQAGERVLRHGPGSGRLSGWRAVWDTLRSNAAVPLRLRRAWRGLTVAQF